jgi:hypothetical protein
MLEGVAEDLQDVINIPPPLVGPIGSDSQGEFPCVKAPLALDSGLEPNFGHLPPIVPHRLG